MLGPRKAIALIVVVGVLGILTILTTCFVTMARLERQASGQRLNATKALLLARSGLEDAMARLSSGQDPSARRTRYGGEDADLSGAFSGIESAQEFCRAGQLDVESCPLAAAMRPSFPVFSGIAPAQMGVEGRQRGYSGHLSGDFAATGNAYALKVEDESAKINVNGGFLDAMRRDSDVVPDYRDTDVRNTANWKDSGRGWNGQLTRILNLLGTQPEVGITGLGDLLVSRRPQGGYLSMAQVQTASSSTTDLSPYLTNRSWVDPKVIHPNAFPGQETPAAFRIFTAMNEVKRDRLQLKLEEEGRPPVNLNAAARPVLMSLLQDLKGVSWHAVDSPRAYAIDSATAAGITDRILTRRATAPFASWSDFSAFCDSLVDQDVIAGLAPPAETYGGGNLSGADLLKANFDPNTSLNKQLPDQILWRWIDKSDLSIWSTEGSLGPTGIFRISSLGRILASDGRLLAQRQLSSFVEAFRLLRQTTQRDFVANRPFGEYLSLSPGGAFGYRTTGATASWRNASWGDDRGLAAMTYPCPPTAPPCDRDGYLALATVQEGDSPPAQGPLMFLHHLDDSLDADVGTPGTRLRGSWDASLQNNLWEDIWPRPTVEPNSLLPDGFHSQLNRCPGFPALENLPVSWRPGTDPYPSNHGVVSYWVKQSNGGTSVQFSCMRYVDWTTTQTMEIGEGEFQYGCWGIIAENTDLSDDLLHERQASATCSAFALQALKPDLRWHLVTAWFDTDQAVSADEAAVRVLGVQPFTSFSASGMTQSYGASFRTSDAKDLLNATAAIVFGPQNIHAGSPNQVIDEVAIYDFLDSGDLTGLKAIPLASNRYADGRYYKGDDARFLSSVLEPDLGRPVRLFSARWTEYLPRESRQEITASGGAVRGMPAKGTPRLIDSRLLNSRLELSLLSGAGDLASVPLQSLTQGAGIDRSLPGFRYRVRFVNEIANPTENGVLETPFLDDITFAWQAATGPRILDWGP